MKILVTAFNAFGDLRVNSSEMALRKLEQDGFAGSGVELITAILRTEYEAAGFEIIRLIREQQPGMVVCFGVARGERRLRLERIARNLDQCASPDNTGKVRLAQQIVADAPPEYFATFPYGAVAAAFDRSGIPWTFSDDAGGYVCNHVFFQAIHEIAGSGITTPCGFLHVPPVARAHNSFGLSLAEITKAMKVGIMSAVSGAADPIWRNPIRRAR